MSARTIAPYPRRMADEDETEDELERQETDGFGWRYWGLQDWDTDEILETLSGLGVDSDVDRFRIEAERFRSVQALAASWQAGMDPDDLWSDFMPMAVNELWHRHASDMPAPEIVDDWLRECDEMLNVDPLDVPGVQLRLGGFVDYLAALPEEDRPVEFERICDDGLIDELDLFPHAIETVGLHDVERAIRVYDVIRPVVRYGPAPYAEALGTVLIACHRADDARKVVTEALADRPDDAISYVACLHIAYLAGDFAAMPVFAEGALRRASTHAAWVELYDDVANIFHSAGMEDQLAAVRRNAPGPASAGAPVGVPGVSAGRVRKIGPNEPCPCGSGQKYKKCHGRALPPTPLSG